MMSRAFLRRLPSISPGKTPNHRPDQTTVLLRIECEKRIPGATRPALSYSAPLEIADGNFARLKGGRLFATDHHDDHATTLTNAMRMTMADDVGNRSNIAT